MLDIALFAVYFLVVYAAGAATYAFTYGRLFRGHRS